MISAKVIADSISPAGHRLTTIEARFPRQILAEVNTHRALSRNSASSRAVPVRKMLDQVKTDPFIPLKWQSARPGMQGGEEVDSALRDLARHAWLTARDHAVVTVEGLLHLGIHKTMPNRLLEPWAWHTAILSATDAGWENFFRQRRGPDAEIHMWELANAIFHAMRKSFPDQITNGQWHLPYVSEPELTAWGVESLRQLSVARCARVSYLTHDGRRDPDADFALYRKLVSADPPHWSPLEHVATPADGVVSSVIPLGNFTGWAQLRHLTV